MKSKSGEAIGGSNKWAKDNKSGARFAANSGAMAMTLLEAAGRADEPLDTGDMASCETWHRILNAIERLKAKVPADGEGVHWCGVGATARLFDRPLI